jgi:RNA polymerase sigma-B factor
MLLHRLEHAAQAGLARVVGDTPVRGRGFAAFAVSTAAVELRNLWPGRGVAPGLHLDRLRMRLPDAVEELARHLGRSPRPSEVAAVLEEDVGDVIEAIADDQSRCEGRP